MMDNEGARAIEVQLLVIEEYINQARELGLQLNNAWARAEYAVQGDKALEALAGAREGLKQVSCREDNAEDNTTALEQPGELRQMSILDLVGEHEL